VPSTRIVVVVAVVVAVHRILDSDVAPGNSIAASSVILEVAHCSRRN